MREFTLLIGQFCLIALIQTITDVFLDEEKRPYLKKFINIAAILAGLYLLLQFVFNHIINEISAFMRFQF